MSQAHRIFNEEGKKLGAAHFYSKTPDLTEKKISSWQR